MDVEIETVQNEDTQYQNEDTQNEEIQYSNEDMQYRDASLCIFDYRELSSI